MSKTKQGDWKIYRRLVLLARPYWAHIFCLFLLGLLSTPLALLTPLPLKIAVDSVIGQEPLPAFLKAMVPDAITQTDFAVLVFAVVLMMALALANRLHSLISSLLRTYTADKLQLRFRERLFRHLQRLSLGYHDSKGTSDSVYRIQYDAPAINWISIDGVIPFISAAIKLACMIYITAMIDGQLALVALAISPFLFILARAYRGNLRTRYREIKKHDSSTVAVLQETLSAVRVVKAFGREDHEHARYVDHANQTIGARLRVTLAEGTLGILIGMTTTAGTAAVLFVGVRNVQTGVLTLGDLLLVLAYLAQLYDPLKTLARKLTSMQSHFTSAERALQVLDEEPEVFEKPHARPLRRAQGAVTFEEVCFAYDGSNEVLSDVSFEVPTGTRVGIAGPTGAGKTTMMTLLTRLYDPQQGRIMLDGIDLRDYRLADLRNQFSIVLQEPVLFSSSIAENIEYARPCASMKEIVEAAKRANAHDFIFDLPDGYDTLVGERGMRLSGGERQRIGLARAFLKDAPILILDEPTSSVDTKTETAIMVAMERLMSERTTFIIAHRLNTLDTCDFVFVLNDGKIIKHKSVSQIVVAIG